MGKFDSNLEFNGLVIEDVEKDRRYNVDPSLVRKEPQHVQVFSQTHIVDFSCLD
ncbi:hypothetical protein ACJIZ3_011180 [Penstemon smallii]|uniref:Uncharacterized protein n=1 Tax=Penstemon smallii TaxID=265156 RepID=A0ABD3ULL1_9LAMI